MPAHSLDEVIAQLTVFIDRSPQAQSRLGYFAAPHRLVTINVKTGIQQGRFHDGARLARLDVAFAHRALEALEAYQQAQPCAACWRVAFEASLA